MRTVDKDGTAVRIPSFDVKLSAPPEEIIPADQEYNIPGAVFDSDQNVTVNLFANSRKPISVPNSSK